MAFFLYGRSNHNSQAILRSLSNKEPFTCHAFKLKKLIEKTIDPNGWNKVNIKANGPNIEIKINGITTAKYIEETDLPTKGCICLQTHSGNPYEVWYRNIYLTNL